MVDDDLAWDDDHPTLQQIPKPSGWETLIQERAAEPRIDEDLIATIEAKRVDVRHELTLTKRRLTAMTLVALTAMGVCVALGWVLWKRGAAPVTERAAPVPPSEAASPTESPTKRAKAASERPDGQVPTTLGDPEPVAAEVPDFGISAEGDGIVMFVDGSRKGQLPLTVTELRPGLHDVRFEDASGRKRVVQIDLGADEHRDFGTVAFDPSKVQVVISLATPGTAVMLQPEGGQQRQLSGPWPMTLELEPGKYALVGAGRGRQTYVRPLDLKLDRPYREVTVRLR